MAEKHWKSISTSRFPWEQEALDFIYAGFPAQDNYLAWSNFEFIADDGSINEVDLLVACPQGIFLIECKGQPGSVSGDAHQWIWERDSQRCSDENPLLLANRKCKRLKSLLARQRAFRGAECPFIEPLVSSPTPRSEYCSRATPPAGFACAINRPLRGNRSGRVSWRPSAGANAPGSRSATSPSSIARRFAPSPKPWSRPPFASAQDLFEFGELQGFTMESAGDATLARQLRAEGALDLTMLRQFGEDLLRCVQYLDQKGVAHRDIKPENIGIRISRGKKRKELCLFDFSLAGSPPDSHGPPSGSTRSSRSWRGMRTRCLVSLTDWTSQCSCGRLCVARQRYIPSSSVIGIIFFTRSKSASSGIGSCGANPIR